MLLIRLLTQTKIVNEKIHVKIWKSIQNDKDINPTRKECIKAININYYNTKVMQIMLINNNLKKNKFVQILFKNYGKLHRRIYCLTAKTLQIII